MSESFILLKADAAIDPEGEYYDPYMSYVIDYWSYYGCYVSVLVHLFAMGFGLSSWCGGSKIAMLYSVQFLVLHAFCWAIPDRRYTAYVKKNAYLFFTLAFVNLAAYFLLIYFGISTYAHNVDGLAQMLGLSVAVFQIIACTPMVLCVGNSSLRLRSHLINKN